jgi:hypothetical protein
MKKAVEAILKPSGSPAARRAAGVNLERKKGSGKSRLDPYKEEIVALLRNGSPKNFVAKRYIVCEPTLYNFIEKHQLDVEPRLERE